MSCKEIMNRNMVILRRNEQLEHQNRQIINQHKQILDQQETIKAMDQVIQEQSAALGEQRKRSGRAEIQGVPALRVKDGYWVDFKGYCDLADMLWSRFGGEIKNIRYDGLQVVYKEELD